MNDKAVARAPERVPASQHLHYAGGGLHVEQVALEEIASRFGTPCYVYSTQALDGAYRSIDGALEAVPHTVAYAVKANSNLALMSRLARAGCGADIVSAGELSRALKAGFAPDRIVFSGVGKRDDELEAALRAGIRSIHAESAQEIEAIETIAQRLGKRATLSLRVNPHVDARTHPYIATGLENSKFGLSLPSARALLPRLLSSPHLKLDGIACHIGSMVASPEPMAEAAEIVARFARECMEAGAEITTIDTGGGWPVVYGNEAQDAATHATFGRAIIDAVARGAGADHGLTLMIEPGRSIVGDAGVLLTRVLYVKQERKRFVVVDAAMTELLRPALYQAYHAVMPVSQAALDTPHSAADLVGPVCESSDFLAAQRELPALSRGDLVVLRHAGAYAACMASNYNARPLAPEVLVEGAQARLVRRRQSIEAMWADEVLE